MAAHTKDKIGSCERLFILSRPKYACTTRYIISAWVSEDVGFRRTKTPIPIKEKYALFALIIFMKDGLLQGEIEWSGPRLFTTSSPGSSRHLKWLSKEDPGKQQATCLQDYCSFDCFKLATGFVFGSFKVTWSVVCQVFSGKPFWMPRRLWGQGCKKDEDCACSIQFSSGANRFPYK